MSLLVAHIRVGKLFWRGRLEGQLARVHHVPDMSEKGEIEVADPQVATLSDSAQELGSSAEPVKASRLPQQTPPAYELLVLDAPLSIYLGWCCCASLVNLTIALQ